MEKPDYIKKELLKIHVSLSDIQAEQLYTYYLLLSEKNKVMNLTAITAFPDVVTRHFSDSLSPLSVKELREYFIKPGVSILDLGTGAGFPGIPLAIALPESEITLADSLQKRTAFLETVKDELKLQNIRIINGRAEELGKNEKHREKYDIVVSRAVAELSVLSEYCMPFVKIGGFFAAWKGPGVHEEIEHAKKAMESLGGNIENIYKCNIPGEEREQYLLIIRKEEQTPGKYPRRAGIPTKRPL